MTERYSPGTFATVYGGVGYKGGKVVTTYERQKNRGSGMAVRFSPIKGVTPKSVLDRHIWLPAVISDTVITEDALHNEYDTISAGQFSMAAMGDASARQLRTGEYDTLILETSAKWLTIRHQNPAKLNQTLDEILRAKKAVLLTVTFHPNPSSHPEEQFPITFRELTREVHGPERDTTYRSLQFSEWRDHTTGRRSDAPGRKHGDPVPTTKNITASDTLSSLSMEYYGSYAFWKQIRDANGITAKFGQNTAIVSLSGRWKTGAKIKIPAVSGSGQGSSRVVSN